MHQNWTTYASLVSLQRIRIKMRSQCVWVTYKKNKLYWLSTWRVSYFILMPVPNSSASAATSIRWSQQLNTITHTSTVLVLLANRWHVSTTESVFVRRQIASCRSASLAFCFWWLAVDWKYIFLEGGLMPSLSETLWSLPSDLHSELVRVHRTFTSSSARSSGILQRLGLLLVLGRFRDGKSSPCGCGGTLSAPPDITLWRLERDDWFDPDELGVSFIGTEYQREDASEDADFRLLLEEAMSENEWNSLIHHNITSSVPPGAYHKFKDDCLQQTHSTDRYSWRHLLPKSQSTLMAPVFEMVPRTPDAEPESGWPTTTLWTEQYASQDKPNLIKSVN